jgi:hypothetical protein
MSLAISISVSKAGLIGVTGGTSAPSSTLGPYTMTPFPADTQPANYTPVSSVASPLGGFVTFSSPLHHAHTPGEWGTWSHGYNGDVYYTAGAQSVTLGMPGGTLAFYLYAQSNPFETHTITATASDGLSTSFEINQDVNGYQGASYYGFYGTESSMISSITVASETTDFAIGEFGIASIPAPGAICLGCIGLNFIGLLSRQQKL